MVKPRQDNGLKPSIRLYTTITDKNLGANLHSHMPNLSNPLPPTHPINSVERVYESRTFPKFQYILYRVGDGELQEIFEKDACRAK